MNRIIQKSGRAIQTWIKLRAKIFTINFSLKKEKNENGKNRHYSFKMADNDLKIWQNNLLPNPFHMVDAKFDLVLRPISDGNPAMPFYSHFQKATYVKDSYIHSF